MISELQRQDIIERVRGELMDLMRQIQDMKNSVTNIRLDKLQTQISEMESELEKLSRPRGEINVK